MHIYKIKTSFFCPEMPKATAHKTGLYIFIFIENWKYYDAIHNFSVWLKTSYNQPDINQFQSNTEKMIFHC